MIQIRLHSESDYSIKEEIDNRLKSLLKMESVLASSKLNLKAAQTKQKEQYDAKHPSPTYQVGDLVWYTNCRKSQRKGGKLESNWIGKRIIETNIGDGAYKLKGIKRTYIATQLKPSCSIEDNSEPYCETLESNPKKLHVENEEYARDNDVATTFLDPLCTSELEEVKESYKDLNIIPEDVIPLRYTFLTPDVNWQKTICNEFHIPFTDESSNIGRDSITSIQWRIQESLVGGILTQLGV